MALRPRNDILQAECLGFFCLSHSHIAGLAFQLGREMKKLKTASSDSSSSYSPPLLVFQLLYPQCQMEPRSFCSHLSRFPCVSQDMDNGASQVHALCGAVRFLFLLTRMFSIKNVPGLAPCHLSGVILRDSFPTHLSSHLACPYSFLFPTHSAMHPVFTPCLPGHPSSAPVLPSISVFH